MNTVWIKIHFPFNRVRIGRKKCVHLLSLPLVFQGTHHVVEIDLRQKPKYVRRSTSNC